MYHHHRTIANNPSRVDRDDEKRMLPCRYFLAGFCHNGQRCKFFHPNMHTREPFIRVPDLPPGFSMIPHHGRTRSEAVQSLLGMNSPRPRSRTDRGVFRSPSSTNSNSMTSLSPRLQNRTNEFANKNILSPTSNTYSEYQMSSSCRMGGNGYDEDSNASASAKDSNGKSNSPEPKQIQNTIFNHIDWSEFLMPGVAPPVPTQVPDFINA